MFRHLVLFRIYDEVPDEQIAEAVDVLARFITFAGVTSWIVSNSLDERKGRIIIEDATFVDREAFESFRVDPAHVAAARMMAEISDWWIGDYDGGPA